MPLLDENGTDHIPNNYDITVRNISFSYDRDDTKEVIRNADFTVPQKTSCAIVGPCLHGRWHLDAAGFWRYRPDSLFWEETEMSKRTYQHLNFFSCFFYKQLVRFGQFRFFFVP